MTQSQPQSKSIERQMRFSEYDIDPLILNRWSPRAMSGQQITDEDLMRLFEAADGPPPHITDSHGDLSMQREIRNTGINS